MKSYSIKKYAESNTHQAPPQLTVITANGDADLIEMFNRDPGIELSGDRSILSGRSVITSSLAGAARLDKSR